MHPTSWEEFLELGLLWWVNRILHTLGWSIVVVTDEAGRTVREVYPARVSFFGFDQATDEQKLDAFRSHIERPHAHVEERLRAERDRLRNEVVELRGHQKHDYRLLSVELGETLRFICTRCGHETAAPTHAYFSPCSVEPSELVELEGFKVHPEQQRRLQRNGRGELGLIFDTEGYPHRAWVPLAILQSWEAWGRGEDAP